MIVVRVGVNNLITVLPVVVLDSCVSEKVQVVDYNVLKN